LSNNGYTLILGGARSGKSALAERLAIRGECDVTVLATAVAFDADMRSRIEHHRAGRPVTWTTIEEPLHVARAARSASGFMIVDCMTVWTANVLHERWNEAQINGEVEALIDALIFRFQPTVVVSNEVGLGVHPETELGRSYRDLLGRINSRLAAAAHESLFLVAGRVMRLESVESVLRNELA